MYISLCNHVEPIPIPPRNRQCKNISRQMTLFANTIKKLFWICFRDSPIFCLENISVA